MKGQGYTEAARAWSEEARVRGATGEAKRRVWKVYHRRTQTQVKGRRRKGTKDYARQRKVDPKVYPKASYQVHYERPRRGLTQYLGPRQARKTKPRPRAQAPKGGRGRG